MRLFQLFRKQPAKPAELPCPIDFSINDVPGALEVIDGFPRVHWSKVREAVKPYADHPALDQLWTEIARQWLRAIRDHLQDDYAIYESEQVLLLSAESPHAARDVLQLGSHAYERLQVLLPAKAPQNESSKHVVLLLKSTASYYDYISYFYAESDRVYATSGGVHFSGDYRHTAIDGGCKSHDRTLVHELAHEAVSDRPLPRWLNEGLAKWMEDMVPGFRPPLIDHRQVRLHHRYWSWFGMDHFWSGRSFSGVGSQRLSYQLAEILFRNLLSHRTHRRHVAEFLATADRKDAGAAACRSSFNCSLSELVEEFLGPGPWEPKSSGAEKT